MQKNWGGPYPGDFDCYRRSENIPGNKNPPDNGNCNRGTRKTTLADSRRPASDAAAEASAALALSAALLAGDKPFKAKKYMRSSRALYTFAMWYPGTLVSGKNKVWQVAFTYRTQFEETNRLWASAVHAFVANCDKDGSKKTQFCDRGKAGEYEGNAWSLWNRQSVCKTLFELWRPGAQLTCLVSACL